MNLCRTFALLLLCFTTAVASAASPNVVISQVYGGGGSGTAGTAYTNDYVELFNTTSAAVPIGGWSIQYGSSTGQFGNTGNVFVFPANTSIPANKYLTVKLGATGAAGATFSFDYSSSGLSMAAASGKVALANVSGTLACGATATPCILPDPRIVDSVSYGATNNAEGGASVNNGVGLNSSNPGAIRKNSGCTDTDNNSADFIVTNVAGGLVPRTIGSSPHVCGAVNQPPAITAPANPAATVAQDSAPFTLSLTASDDGNVFFWTSAAGNGVSSVSVSGGQGTANATFTVNLQAGFSGTASFTATLSDNVNPAVSRTVNVAVTPAAVNDAPAITPFANPVATKAQDAAPFTVSVSGSDDNDSYTWGATAGTGVASATVSTGQGTANATYTVTLQAGFSGTAAFTVSLSDGVNAAVTHPVTVTVTPAPPPPIDHVVISQVYGGGGNTGAAFQNDFVELYNPDTVSHDLSGWTIQYGSATGTTWQVQPLGGTIAPGEYYLIKLATNGTAGSVVPDANINGTVNLSGTNGKVALVRNGDALSGCVVSSPVVDLVGYGSTANCREGATNAPTTSNATAAIRKNGGFTDTNVNGADFTAGTPNPRRTSPIVELAPSVLSTDPRNTGSNAPRDANITVNFTEPVQVEDGWFTITCATTGQHDSATVAPGGLTSWIIIPNVNFLAGEQCTVTIVKEFVRDTDLDDGGTNTDLLTHNYSATFTVATGTAPAYPASVHLTMGMPAPAETDLDSPNAYLMEKPEFALSYNRDRAIPNWVSWHLADEWIGSLVRNDTFRADPAVPAEWYRVTGADYQSSGFDRGHMVPNADRDPETSSPINQATFLMTNIIPQTPDNNQGPWAAMEGYLRTLLPSNELYIVAGGSGTGGTGSNGFTNAISSGRIAVPAVTWKVALVLPKASGDDVARVTAGARTIAVIMPNIQGIRNVDWMTYLTTVDEVEQLTGYDFFSEVADAVENAIEAGVNGNNPPGVVNQSFSTNEDSEKSFTLEAANPGSNSLTYTIVTGPAHGTLSGSGANQTYTPAPDYNGNDSFTFKVSDGSLSSSTATMSITVFEVNDAPSATADAKSTDEDAALQFPASDLTANDTTSEAGETLTVSSVTATGDTHGTVALNGGVVTYTPAANYHGPASFTYEVCDNGVTRGQTAPQCTSAVVDVTVASVNDAPTASLSAPSSAVEGGAVSATVSSDDIDGDSLAISWTVTKDGAPFANGTGSNVSFTPDDNGAYVITATAADASANGSASATVSVSNAAPSIAGVTGPTSQLAAGGSSTIVVTYADAGAADTHTATFTWSDGATVAGSCTAGTCTATRTHTAAGIYTVSIVVADDDGATAASSFGNVVVYDVNAGFVTGGGWLATASGKANLNVNVKYQKGATPAGSTKFDVAGGTFQSTSHDWLVVTGSTATWQGSGAINGAGNYGFTVTVTDAASDAFAVRVYDKATNATVYETSGNLGGGNITIHR